MAYVTKLPLQKTDPALRAWDTGPAVEEVQKFLQKQPEEIAIQEHLSGFGDNGYSLLDGSHYGKLDTETGRALQTYQLKNKTRIMKAGNLSELEFLSEKDTVGFATWAVMLEDQGKSSTSSEPDSTTPTLPPPPPPLPVKLPDPPEASTVSGATHYVLTVNPNHRLALREDAAYVAVSKEASQDEDKKGKRIVMMPNYTLLKIIEPHVGYKCEWHRVEVISTDPIFDNAREMQRSHPVFCFAEFVRPLEGTPRLLPVLCMECQNKPTTDEKKIFPNWMEKDICEPWYDEETCSYYIVVTTPDKSSDNQQIERQKSDALFIGVDNLLEFYDRERHDRDTEEYLASFSFATVNEWYLDERPDSEMKFLVRVYGKFFDAIPGNTDLLDSVPTAESRKLPSGWNTTIFLSSTIEEDIDKVATLLEMYAEDVLSWDGELVDYDFSEEAERLRWFIPVFKKFLIYNNSPLNPGAEEQYEIGFSGPCFKLEYVLYGETGEFSIPLRIGLDCFKRSEPIVYEHTMGYLFYLQDIIRDALKRKLPWSEFINTYACPPVVIRPAAPSPPARKVPPPPALSDGPIKTGPERSKEDEVLREPGFKQKLLEARRMISLYVGDSLLSCENLPKLLDQISSLEDLYDKILNKVSIKDLTGAAAACLIGRLQLPDLRMLACKLVLKALNYEQLQNLLTLFDGGVLSRIQENLDRASGLSAGRTAQNNVLALREAIQFTVDEEELCRALTSLDFEAIEQKIRMLSSFKLPGFAGLKIAVPTISIPDNLITEDLLREIAKQIMEAIYKLLSTMLIDLIKSLIRALCSQCRPTNQKPENYGSKNLNDVLKSASNFSGINPEDIGGRLFDDYGMGDYSADELNQEIKDFFDDLSELLKPSELCALLNGQASNEVINIARRLIITKYPALAQRFSTVSEIRSLFEYIGRFLPHNVCEAIIATDEPVISSICGFSEEENVRRSLLSEKLSSEQIQEQIDNLRARNKKQLEQLLGLMDENFLDNAVPKSGNSMVPYDPSPVKHLNNLVTNQVFDSLEMLFNQDLTSFVDILTRDQSDQISLPSKEEMKTSYDARRKLTTDKISDKDREILRRDPDGTGMNRGDTSLINFVAPKLREALYNGGNLYKQDENYHNDDATYVLKSFQESAVDIAKKIPPSEGPILVSMPNQDPLVNVGGGVASEPKYFSSDTYGTLEGNILKGALRQFYMGTVADGMLSSDAIVRYKLNKTLGDKIQESDEVVVNKFGMSDLFVYQRTEDIRGDLANVVMKYVKFPVVTTVKQEVFATFVTNNISKILGGFSGVKDLKSKSSTKKINTEEIYSYFKEDAFHRISLDLLHIIMSNIAESKMFNMKDFQDIDFIGSSRGGVCVPSPKTSLLNVEELKEQTQERYKQIVNQHLLNNDSVVPIEKSNLEGVVLALIRVYVIELLLKGMFVFSKYRAGELLDDPLIVQYIAWEIEVDLRSTGLEFYDAFLAEVKKIAESSGENIQYGDSADINTRWYYSELSSNFQSGFVYLKYLIKKQIKSLSPQIESMLLIDQNSLSRKIFDEKIMIRDVTKTFEDKFVGKFGAGGFVFEQYVHVYSENGRGVDYVTSWHEFMSTAGVKRGNVGLRLIYIPPVTENVKFQDVWTSLGLDVSEVSEFSNRIRAYSMNGDTVHPIILWSTEENKTLDSVVNFESATLEGFFNSVRDLKGIFYESEEFKLLFEYVFDLDQFLSLVMIYNINVIARIVKDLGSAFNNTKQHLRVLFRTLANPGKQEWWQQEDDEIEKAGGNSGIFQERMGNIKAGGSNSSMAAIAQRATTIIVKAAAERFDPAYKMLKMLDDQGAAVAGLSWASMFLQIMPMNLIPLIGWGPPLTPTGMLALSLEPLSGEKKDKKEREQLKEAEESDGKCPEGEKK